MTNKFSVGQPVWTIGHCSGKWYPATVISAPRLVQSTCLGCRTHEVGLQYQVEMESGELAPAGRWSSPEGLLRPRDPAQFKAADEDFVLILKAPQRYESIKSYE
jgi:hypothetical protein